jgi:molybdopterin-containing oxidoreductase family iron-sulfur binding subunit
LKELAGEMANGQVKTLVITGWNPAFTAPADLEFEANLKKVSDVIYLAQDLDETASVSKWSIPAAHFLESWDDAVALDGTASIQQPTIQPLHGGKTAAELVAVVTGYKDQKAYDIVRNHWLPTLSGGEKAWKKALHDGVFAVAPAAASALTTTPVFHTASPAPPTGGYEVVFVPSWSVFDGRFVNNAWMQEAPDPITKLTWDNAALLSPATAKKLGVTMGDVIAIERNGKKVEGAVMVQPGQADDTVVIPVGYGRSKVGQVGEGTGFNAYQIRTTDTFGYGGGFNVTKAGRVYPLARTQEYDYQEEPQLVGFQAAVVRPIVREGTIDQFKKEPNFANEMVEHPPLKSLYGDYDYSKGQQWAMTIDLNACIGCNACMVACVAENNIGVVGKEQVARGREMHWIRLDRYFTGPVEDPQIITAPILGDAARHAGLPRQQRERAQVRLGDQVRVARLAADDRRVAQVGAHDRRAERQAVVGRAVELADRHVLAAGDAVQVAVDDADRRHGLVAELRRARRQPSLLDHALSPLKASNRRNAACLAASLRSAGASINASPFVTPTVLSFFASLRAQPSTMSVVDSG